MKQQWLPYALKNAPRYTSYPTAVQFSDAVRQDQVQLWLDTIDPHKPISLYVHVPFCEKLCWYCGCHTSISNGYGRIERYYETLLQEIELWKAALGRHGGASHIHFGGGTPNALNPDHMLQLLETLHTSFQIQGDAEIAIELDPRTLDQEMIRSLAAGGVTRASLGVQDFNEKVQHAVNRVQPYELVAHAVDQLRHRGIEELSFDLLYGLPFQTAATVRQTAQQAASLSPNRISAFGYAHVPWFAKHQKAIDESALPGVEERFEQFGLISETLVEEGYVAIGLDHFAREDDPLAVAAVEGVLRRNFQGYTTDPCDTLIAIGPSGISEFPGGYSQNEKNMTQWASAVHCGELPIERGVPVSREDRLRRNVIEHLMCDFRTDIGAICREHGWEESKLDASISALAELETAGLCVVNDRVVVIPDNARPLVRTVAQAFDAYAIPQDSIIRHARAV